MNRKPLNLGAKSNIQERMQEINKLEHPVQSQLEQNSEVEVIQMKNEMMSSTERDKVMKKYNLKKPTVGIRFELDEDDNMELDILCARTGTTKKDFLLDWVKEGIRREKRQFEK